MRQAHLAFGFLLVALPGTLLAQDKAGPNDNKPPKGFTALFNGTDLTNWQGVIDVKTLRQIDARRTRKETKGG